MTFHQAWLRRQRKLRAYLFLARRSVLPLRVRRWACHRATWLPQVGDHTPIRYYLNADHRITAVHNGNPNWAPPEYA